MPGGDRTGPAGMGPMTGRGMGYCGGYPTPGYMNPGVGRGFGGFGGFGGRGWGGGRARRNWFYATGLTPWQRAAWGDPAFGVGSTYDAPPPAPPAMSHRQELNVLKRQAETYVDALDDIKKRIAELETPSQEKQEA